MRNTIDMARETGAGIGTSGRWLITQAELDRLVDLVRADERDRAMRENAYVQAEREACAKVAEDSDHVVNGRGYYDQLGNADATVKNIAAAIRARGAKHD
jgi:hypothetical protein